MNANSRFNWLLCVFMKLYILILNKGKFYSLSPNRTVPWSGGENLRLLTTVLSWFSVIIIFYLCLSDYQVLLINCLFFVSVGKPLVCRFSHLLLLSVSKGGFMISTSFTPRTPVSSHLAEGRVFVGDRELRCLLSRYNHRDSIFLIVRKPSVQEKINLI